MSPPARETSATPARTLSRRALLLAGPGSLVAALLLAYDVGHGMLLLVAGALPGNAQALLARAGCFERWLPGRRFLALVLGAAGAWRIGQGLGGLGLS